MSKRTSTARRAGRRQRLEVGYAGEDYAVKQRAVDGVVAIERMQEGQAVPGINLGRRAANQSMAHASLQVEIQAAELATTAANYPADNHARR